MDPLFFIIAKLTQQTILYMLEYQCAMRSRKKVYFLAFAHIDQQGSAEN